MEFLSIHHADPVFDHIFSDTPTLSRFLSGPPRFSIFCPWTPIQKCAELARLARKLDEPGEDDGVPVAADVRQVGDAGRLVLQSTDHNPPTLVPARRSRKRSLATVLAAARKAGADHVMVDGVKIALSPTAAAPAESNGNEFDQWKAKHAR
jgi:hypothetical protein